MKKINFLYMSILLVATSTVGIAQEAPSRYKCDVRQISQSIQTDLAKLAEAAEDKTWVEAPTILDSNALARVALTGGSHPGEILAVVPKDESNLVLWIDRFDVASQKDIAHVVGAGIRVGEADSLDTYAEKKSLFPLEMNTPPEILAQIPFLVKKSGDPALYVRWPKNNGPAILFLLSEPFDQSLRTLNLKLTTFDGMEVTSISANSSDIIYLHFYAKDSQFELACNVDFNIQRIDIVAKDGTVVSSSVPKCRTNLGGVYSTFFSVPKSGVFEIKPISSSPNIAFSSGELVVN
jgi:hypothetical protein